MKKVLKTHRTTFCRWLKGHRNENKDIKKKLTEMTKAILLFPIRHKKYEIAEIDFVIFLDQHTGKQTFDYFISII